MKYLKARTSPTCRNCQYREIALSCWLRNPNMFFWPTIFFVVIVYFRILPFLWILVCFGYGCPPQSVNLTLLEAMRRPVLTTECTCWTVQVKAGDVESTLFYGDSAKKTVVWNTAKTQRPWQLASKYLEHLEAELKSVEQLGQVTTNQQTSFWSSPCQDSNWSILQYTHFMINKLAKLEHV